jgi:uncharacterized protein YdhG (YjbR/CyaY superfamily)
MIKEKSKKFLSHEDYFENATPEARPLLEAIQQKVELILPKASRCISYNMPAFKADRVFFYFAAFKNHIGIYPPVKNNKKLIKELQPYRNAKGNVSFPLNQPLPIDLIAQVGKALYNEYLQT